MQDQKEHEADAAGSNSLDAYLELEFNDRYEPELNISELEPYFFNFTDLEPNDLEYFKIMVSTALHEQLRLSMDNE